MSELIEHLKRNPVVSLATVRNGEPAVRLFQFLYLDGGRIYFCTSEKKKVYGDLAATPVVEFCNMAPTKEILRVKGRVEWVSDQTVKDRIMNDFPNIRAIYNSSNNPSFKVFAVVDYRGTLGKLGEEPLQIGG